MPNSLLGITGKGFTQGLKTSTEFGEADKRDMANVDKEGIRQKE